MKIRQESMVVALIVLSMSVSTCVSRRIYDSRIQFLSSPQLVDSGNSPSYREISKQTVDCPSLVDSSRYCPYINGYAGEIAQRKSFSDKSISPWITKIDTDPSRSPQAFPVVCCSCMHCVDMASGVPRLMQDHYSKAVYVKKEIRRIEEGFRSRYIKVAVGCTCVYKPFGILQR